MSREKQIEEMTCPYCGFKYDDEDIRDANEMVYNNGYAKGYADGKGEWISVEERLPETTCECLAVGKSGCIFLLCYSSRYMAFNATDGDGEDRWKVNDITHWMPLPEPPKGE